MKYLPPRENVKHRPFCACCLFKIVVAVAVQPLLHFSGGRTIEDRRKCCISRNLFCWISGLVVYELFGIAFCSCLLDLGYFGLGFRSVVVVE